MIILELNSGLGNQLFGYSFARALSKDLNKELYISIFYVYNIPEECRHCIYGLNSFNIKGIIGVYPFFKTRFLKPVLWFLYYFFKFCPLLKTSPIFKQFFYFLENTLIKFKFNFRESDIFDFYTKDTYNFNFNHDELKFPAYFSGVFGNNCDSKYRLFVSDKNFNKYNDLIHEDLTYLSPLSKESQIIVDDMNKYDSVLLHVRHGDYTGLLNFGFCSEEYYKKSIDIIASKVDNPKFFIFSDDIEGAKEMLTIDYPHMFVDFKENSELVARGNAELLKLMSSCKHFIIANSTFSWWAAFLGENQDKIIITPEPWFQSRRIMGVDSIDNRAPIKVLNNNHQIFNNSKKLICKLNENDFLFKNLKYDKIGNSFSISNLDKNSKIVFKNKFNSIKKSIIKISLESNCFNCFRIFFKTIDKNKYCDENSFKVFYYEDDDFDQYLIMPKNAILNDLKIVPAYPFENEGDYVVIKSFEIKEIN